MRKNVGTVDAYIRLTLGILGLAFSTARMVRRPYRTPWLLLFASAMKVAEGVTRFCPMLYATGISTRKGMDSLTKTTLNVGEKVAKSTSAMGDLIAKTVISSLEKGKGIPEITADMINDMGHYGETTEKQMTHKSENAPVHTS